MRVALFGGTGFVGGYLVDELLAQGHEPVVLVRPDSQRKLRQPERCHVVNGDIADAGAVRETLAGCAAAIYNIGILRELPRRGITFQALHFEGARRTMDLAEEAGTRRYLLMSANGVKPDGTGYQRTKYMAERYLEATDLDWTIFRPSVLFGPPRGHMEFATQLYQEIIRPPMPAPLFFDGPLPLNAGAFQLSPIHVQDVATIFVKALSQPQTIGQTYCLGGPQALEWRRILETIAAGAGTRKVAVPIPAWAVKAVAGLLDGLERLPVTRDQITMLMEGNTCDPSVIYEVFELDPVPFTPTALAYLRERAAT